MSELDYETLEPIDNLYDFEIEIVDRLTHSLFQKWGHQRLSPEKIREFEKEVKGRFQDAGFVAELNAVEYLIALIAGAEPLPPMEIVVLARVEGIGEFDHERKQFEVRQSRSRGGN